MQTAATDRYYMDSGVTTEHLDDTTKVMNSKTFICDFDDFLARYGSVPSHLRILRRAERLFD